MASLGTIKYLTIHCAATPEGQDVKASTISQWDIQKFNQISYHWVVELDGKKVRTLSDTQKGAHVGGNNTGNIGICYVGGVETDGKTPKDTRTSEQKAALATLVNQYKDQYPDLVIKGHRDWPNVNKACPSFNVSSEYGSGDFDFGEDNAPIEEGAGGLASEEGSAGGAGEGGSGCFAKYGLTNDDATGTDGEGNGTGFGSDNGGSDPVDANATNTPPEEVFCQYIPKNAGESYQLTKNVSIGDLSSKAVFPHAIPTKSKLGLSRSTILCNMLYLASNALEPVLSYYRGKGYKVVITSGYRNNTGGSDHNKGAAADLQFYAKGKMVTGPDLSRLVKEINETLKIPYTQMIEERSRVIHIACRKEGNSAVKLWWSPDFGDTMGGRGYRYKDTTDSNTITSEQDL